MVKFCLPVLFLSGFLFVNCNVDLLGLVTSSNIDERLKERDNFRFLTDSQRNPDFGDDFFFFLVAETHIEDGNAWGLEKIADIIAADDKIKFVIVIGDITQYGSEKDVKKFIEIVNDFGVPCYPVIGNHDIYFNNWSVWKEYIGSTSYKIDGGSTSLFVLDSANAFLGKEQLDWLEKELINTHGNIFVFTHSNLFVKGPLDIQQLSDTRERARIVSMLSNKCSIMFMGHSHKRTITKAGGVVYISVEDYAKAKAYCLVTVNGSNISYEFKYL
jgi:predicted phosphodiesterase